MGDLGTVYYESRDLQLRDKILNPILSAVSSTVSVTTNAPADVAVVPWMHGDTLLVHFLNYNYRNTNRSFTAVQNFAVWIRLPPEIEANGKTLTIENPWNTKKLYLSRL